MLWVDMFRLNNHSVSCKWSGRQILSGQLEDAGWSRQPVAGTIGKTLELRRWERGVEEMTGAPQHIMGAEGDSVQVFGVVLCEDHCSHGHLMAFWC